MGVRGDARIRTLGGELSDSQPFVAQSASGDAPVGKLSLNLKRQNRVVVSVHIKKRM